MNMTSALGHFDVDDYTLTPAEKATLDEQGYLVLPNALSPDLAARMSASLDRIAAAEGENAGKDFQVEPGATRLGTLINKDPVFDPCLWHPKALAAVSYIIGEDFGLSSVTSRAAQPGEGGQGLHRDSNKPACNILWMVTDFTPKNGPTRVIPGSHQWQTDPGSELPDACATHPDETYLTAPAGTMVAINAHLWHGGTVNTTDTARKIISIFWTQRGVYQQEAHRQLTDESRARLSEAAQFLLDFDE